MPAVRITARDVSLMVTHWITCPPNGYLGSGYGTEFKALLQTPMAAGLADGLIAKAIEDIPPLLMFSPGDVNIYSEDIDFDKKRIVFELAGELVDMGTSGTDFASDQGGDAVYSTDPEPIDTLSASAAAMLHQQVHVVLPDNEQF